MSGKFYSYELTQFFFEENLPGLAWRLDWSTTWKAPDPKSGENSGKLSSLSGPVGPLLLVTCVFWALNPKISCLENLVKNGCILLTRWTNHCHRMGVGEFATCFQAFRKQWKVPSAFCIAEGGFWGDGWRSFGVENLDGYTSVWIWLCWVMLLHVDSKTSKNDHHEIKVWGPSPKKATWKWILVLGSVTKSKG